MSRSPRRLPRTYQVTIDDFPLDHEHIPGAIPADGAAAEKEKADHYAALAASYGDDLACIPDQRVHIFPSGNDKRCLCAIKKEAQ